MTLRQLLDEARLSDLDRELTISVNGEEAVPVRGMARLADDDTGARMMVLTNDEDPEYGEEKQ